MKKYTLNRWNKSTEECTGSGPCFDVSDEEGSVCLIRLSATPEAEDVAKYLEELFKGTSQEAAVSSIPLSQAEVRDDNLGLHLFLDVLPYDKKSFEEVWSDPNKQGLYRHMDKFCKQFERGFSIRVDLRRGQIFKADIVPLSGKVEWPTLDDGEYYSINYDVILLSYITEATRLCRFESVVNHFFIDSAATLSIEYEITAVLRELDLERAAQGIPTFYQVLRDLIGLRRGV